MMVVRSGAASLVSFPVFGQDGMEGFPKSGEIVALPKAKLPMVPNIGREFARMIERTFPAASRHQTCVMAAQATGASLNTIERILSGATKSPDARLMWAVMQVAASRGPVRIGALEARIIAGAAE